MKFKFADNIHDFAKQVFWYLSPIEALKDKDFFLLHLMAKSTDEAYEHTRKHFNYTDEDFIKALKNARSGIFIYEHEWLKWNKHFNINPPLPFPKKYK